MSSSPRASVSTPTGCGTRSSRTTTRRPRSGSRRWAFLPSGCSGAARTTSGRWASPARAGPPRRSSTTRGPSSGPRGGRSAGERNATWSSGTWCSCRTSRTSPITWSGISRPGASTREWASSGSPPCSRRCPPCSRSTRCGPCSRRRPASPGWDTGPPPRRTSPSVCWPTTDGRSPSSSPTVWFPPTTVGATSCDDCCAGPSATPGSCGPTPARTWCSRPSSRRRSTSWGRHTPSFPGAAISSWRR